MYGLQSSFIVRKRTEPSFALLVMIVRDLVLLLFLSTTDGGPRVKGILPRGAGHSCVPRPPGREQAGLAAFIDAAGVALRKRPNENDVLLQSRKK